MSPVEYCLLGAGAVLLAEIIILEAARLVCKVIGYQPKARR